jgi:hypothetical protein
MCPPPHNDHTGTVRDGVSGKGLKNTEKNLRVQALKVEEMGAVNVGEGEVPSGITAKEPLQGCHAVRVEDALSLSQY